MVENSLVKSSNFALKQVSKKNKTKQNNKEAQILVQV